MKNYNRLKNRFISIILTLISIVSIDTIYVFAGGNSDIKTSKYQIKKKAPDTEVSAWDKFLNHLKNLNLGDQNSIISFLTGGGLISIPWGIGLLISRNKQKNMTLEKNIETEDIIILKAWNRILNHRKLKTNEDPEEFCAEEITITTDIQKNIDIIQENIQKKFYNLFDRLDFRSNTVTREEWNKQIEIRNFNSLISSGQNFYCCINMVFMYIVLALNGQLLASNFDDEFAWDSYSNGKQFKNSHKYLYNMCEYMRNAKKLEIFNKNLLNKK